jgi:CcmD family protein
MYTEGKIYVVVAVIAIIFLGLAGYLYRMDRKISALENEK